MSQKERIGKGLKREKEGQKNKRRKRKVSQKERRGGEIRGEG